MLWYKGNNGLYWKHFAPLPNSSFSTEKDRRLWSLQLIRAKDQTNSQSVNLTKTVMSCPNGDDTHPHTHPHTHTHSHIEYTHWQRQVQLYSRDPNSQVGYVRQPSSLPPSSPPYLLKQSLHLLSASLSALNISHLLWQNPINTIKWFPYQSQSPAVGLNKQQRKKTLAWMSNCELGLKWLQTKDQENAKGNTVTVTKLISLQPLFRQTLLCICQIICHVCAKCKTRKRNAWSHRWSEHICILSYTNSLSHQTSVKWTLKHLLTSYSSAQVSTCEFL